MRDVHYLVVSARAQETLLPPAKARAAIGHRYVSLNERHGYLFVLGLAYPRESARSSDFGEGCSTVHLEHFHVLASVRCVKAAVRILWRILLEL